VACSVAWDSGTARLGHDVYTCAAHFPLMNKYSSGHLLLLLLISGKVLMLGSKVFLFYQMAAKFAVTKIRTLLSLLICAYTIVAKVCWINTGGRPAKNFVLNFFSGSDNPSEPTPLSNSSTLTALSKYVTTLSKPSWPH